MSNKIKVIKPTTNRFQTTKSHKRKFDSTIETLPESTYYRKQLEPMLGAVITIEADQYEFIPDRIDGKQCYRLLLKDCNVVKCPTGRNIQLPLNHYRHAFPTSTQHVFIERSKKKIA